MVYFPYIQTLGLARLLEEMVYSFRRRAPGDLGSRSIPWSHSSYSEGLRVPRIPLGSVPLSTIVRREHKSPRARGDVKDYRINSVLVPQRKSWKKRG